MELTLNHPFLFEFVDRTRSSRPPREALAPPSELADIVQTLTDSPSASQGEHKRHLLPSLAFFGD